ncbi:MAG TPA: hypothetical protein VEA16_04820, partial [Vicinamibacterales bacterium]|nr:hypothetical protein [Vicinamibacterales bacterium]
RIEADGGTVALTARSANALLDTVINNTGVIRANSLVERNGEIVLDGGSAGVVSVSGTLQAAGVQSGTTGGTVKVLGDKVGLFGTATVNASGDAGGGTVLIGGNFQGKGPEQNASRTYVGADASINADAVTSGNGGTVIVWSDDSTKFYGSVSARGGHAGGDGGFAEVSGKGSLDFRGNVDLAATEGKAGTLLLDPLNINLTNTADSDTTGFSAGIDNSEAFADDGAATSNFDVRAGGSFAGVGDGTNVVLQATNDITVSSAFDLATATGNRNVSLTLQAGNNINVNAAVTASGTGSLTLTADDNTPNNAGTVTIGAAGSLTTSNQSITITAADFVLTAGGSINAGSGNVTIKPSTATPQVNVGTGSSGFVVDNAEIGAITSSGTITVGDRALANAMVVEGVTAGAKNIRLATAGTINDNAANTAVTLSTGTLTLDAESTIGNSSTFNVDVAKLTIKTEAASFDISNAGTLTELSVVTDGTVGTQTLVSTGLTYTVSEAGSNTTIDSVTSSTALNFSYQNSGGNVVLTSTGTAISVGAGNVALIAKSDTGTITESADSTNTNIDNTGTVTLIGGSGATGAVGSVAADGAIQVGDASGLDLRAGGDIQVDAAAATDLRSVSITNDATSAGAVSVTTPANLTLTIAKAAGDATVTAQKTADSKMNFAFTATAGNIKLADGGAISTVGAGTGTAAGNVTLTTNAASGSITETTVDTAVDITTPGTGTTTLMAGSGTGTIGTAAADAAIDVNSSRLVLDAGNVIAANVITATLTDLSVTARTAANVTRDVTAGVFAVDGHFDITADGADFTINRVNAASALNFSFTASAGHINIANTTDA